MRNIEIRDLSKAFGGRPVLHDLCMTLPSGRVTCLMGPSGIGKTTLLRLLAGLEAPDGGTVTGMDGARIGMVFQEDRLLDWQRAPGLWRYCHDFATPEVDALVAALGDATAVLDRFRADGRGGGLNEYVVLRRNDVPGGGAPVR